MSNRDEEWGKSFLHCGAITDASVWSSLCAAPLSLLHCESMHPSLHSLVAERNDSGQWWAGCGEEAPCEDDWDVRGRIMSSWLFAESLVWFFYFFLRVTFSNIVLFWDTVWSDDFVIFYKHVLKLIKGVAVFWVPTWAEARYQFDDWDLPLFIDCIFQIQVLNF